MEKMPSTSQPKSQNSHMAENARVLLYWNGEIIYGPNGVSYNAIPKRFVRVDSKISLKEFISLMYRTTGINCSQYKLKLISRYPMSFGSSVTYQGVPVEDDGDLHDVLCIPKNFPSLSTVEIYILQKDAQLSSGSVDNQTIVPNTIVGSYTQMLNDGSRAEIVGNERLDYGAFIAGSTRDVRRRNDRNMHGSSTSQMSCTLELESNKKFCEHDHYSTPIQTENHANLECNMVGRLVQNHVKENPSYKVCDVAEEVKNLPGDTTSVLKDWWQQHSKWPYPTEDVKEKLVEETGLQLKQINNWFINQRKRNWQSNSQSVTSLKSKRKR